MTGKCKKEGRKSPFPNERHFKIDLLISFFRRKLSKKKSKQTNKNKKQKIKQNKTKTNKQTNKKQKQNKNKKTKNNFVCDNCIFPKTAANKSKK